MPQVVRKIEISMPPSEVWQWFTTPDALRRWLAPTIDIDLRVGGSYRMMGADDKTWISGTVLELIPEGRIILSWLEEDAGWTLPGRLVIALSAIPAGTEVSLIHDGFAGIGTANWVATEEAYERGADRHHILDNLASLVAGRE